MYAYSARQSVAQSGEAALQTKLQLVISERDSARQRVATLEQQIDMLQDQVRTLLVKLEVARRIG